ncbi:ferritin-like domain-containing protein [Rubricoccus marinus]|uniref:ferritin-like domain-containing protein n=1 Tax=Rubricoccus marinus TaxID=716817 RepID=UPI001C52B5F1|nr:hypothetical protein [Rubricoccus marinus]
MSRLPLFVLALLVLSACDTSGGTDPSALSAEVTDALDAVLLDEHRAEAIYARVLLDFGDVRPFANIIGAEQTHAQALEGLFARYGLDRPANPYAAATVDGYPSVGAACAAGVEAEVDNAALYDRYLGLAMPDDVRRVLTSNRDASLDNHLPAFQRCAS